MSIAPEPEIERMYTVGQVAELFGVTSETIRHWINRGLIKANKPNGVSNGAWRIKSSEVRRFANTKYGPE